MKISPCINYPILSNQKENKLSFKAHYDYGFKIMQTGDGDLFRLDTIKNYTELFRNVKLFKELPQFLTENYPSGVKIYDYACSMGHEAYSIILGLYDDMPKDKAKKYLPILAFDKNPKILNLAQKPSIKLETGELDLFNWFENTNIHDYLKPLRKSKDNQTIYKPQEKLKNNVKFNCGDLLEDLNANKFKDEPCVLFFRNASQFLTKKGRNKLVELLYKHLPSKSTVIIGDMDTLTGISNELVQTGFTQIKKSFPVNFSDKKLAYRYQYCDAPLSKYCFVKP